MNAIEDNPSATYLTNAVSNFGAAYATTQESLQNNNASINAMQGFATHLATSPLQACRNTHSKPIKDVEHEVANMTNNKTKLIRDNPAVAVVAPTTAAGETDSTEATATATVVGITKAVA